MGYYGMIQPHLKRNELMHGRTKGSRNGVSNTPGYVATGKRAVGRRLPDGTYVYDQPGVPNAYDQQRIAAAGTQSAIRGMPGNQNTQRTMAQYGPQNYQQKSAPSQDNRNPFQRAGDWLGARGRDIGSAVNQAGQAIGSVAGRAGDWLGARGRDIGNAASNAASAYTNSRVGQAIVGATDAAGRWAGGMADRLGGAARGAGQFITDRWNNLGQAANEWGGGLARTAKGAARKVREAGTSAGNWLTERGRDIGSAASNATSAYTNSRVGQAIVGATDAAGRWLGARGRDIGRAGEAIRNAPGQIGQAVTNAANQAGEFITGNQSRAKMQGGEAGRKAANIAAGVNSIANPNDRGGVGNRIEESGRRADELYREGAEEYGRTLPGMVENAARGAANSFTGNDVKPKVDAAAKTVSKNQQAAEKAQKAIDNLTPDYKSAFALANTESKRYAKALQEGSPDATYYKEQYDKAMAQYRNIQKEYNGAIAERDAAVKSYRDSVNDYESISGDYNSRPGVAINTTIGNIKSAGEGAMTNAQNFIGNMFGGNKKKKK